MVGREVEVLPGKNLLFTWRGKRKLFELLGVHTENQFAKKMGELQKEDGLDDQLYTQMYCIGLNWKKDEPVISPKEAEDIIEEFCQVHGFGSNEVRDTLIDAFCESGIFDKAVISASRKLKDKLNEDAIIELAEKRKLDTGEAGPTSTSTS